MKNIKYILCGIALILFAISIIPLGPVSYVISMLGVFIAIVYTLAKEEKENE